jgi:hypothetical protein
MLMKQINYVYNDDFAWNRSYFSLAFQELGTKFVGGWEMYQHYNWDPEKQGEMANIEDKEHGVINHGILPRPEFIHQVGKSKMMIGVGSPWWSPSPYDALCQGVPFLNPVCSNLWRKLCLIFIICFRFEVMTIVIPGTKQNGTTHSIHPWLVMTLRRCHLGYLRTNRLE